MTEIPRCPNCGEQLAIRFLLVATDALLGGSQLKIGVKEWPHLVCDACGFKKAASR